VPTPPTTPSPPSATDLAAYRAGRLPLDRFEAVDAWIAAQSPEEQARLLSDEVPTEPMGALDVTMSGPAPAFVPDAGGTARYRITGRLGAGGMGVVELAHDQVLGREVALKRCRARRVDESVASHATRLRAFRREAAITAQLEHPGIVPVHDVGVSLLSEPAFVMKRLDGDSLETLLTRWRTNGQRPDLARIAELMLRIAEAIAYAHRRGVVHRDLKPGNVIVGALGAVHVIDWGLAGLVAESAPTAPRPTGSLLAGTSDAQTTAGTYRLGTPAWMAPEQSGAIPPVPRMDVFALGGLLMALLTGLGPRPGQGGPLDLSPLDRRGLPRGLVAVARRCLSADPTARYQDGEAVAAELRQWLAAGLTQAERAGPLARFVAHLRRSPRLLAASLGLLVASGVVIAVTAMQRAQASRAAAAELAEMASSVDLGDARSVQAVRNRIEALLRQQPGLSEGTAMLTRLRAVEDSFAAQARLEQHRAALATLQQRYRIRGPWPTEVSELTSALATCGFPLDDDVAACAARLKDDRLCADVLAILVQLQRALLIDDTASPLRQTIPQLIRAAAPTPGWQALGTLLDEPKRDGHELLLGEDTAAQLALSEAITADLVLATFAPEKRLVRAAWERWHEDAAAFWPRIMAGRDCLARGDWRTAERHALVALGSEPDSLWPHRILAYVALADDDWEALLREADAGRVENPDHMELVVLSAIGLARSGRPTQAQALIDDCGRADLLQWHRQHPGHPLHAAVIDLLEAGVRLADVPPRLAPLVLRSAK
jgi:tRNA A-37 threonylcarbamoyl transferase component Bud32